jgi:filamentous hemagglutinin family protein
MIPFNKIYTIAIGLSTLSMIVDAEVVLDGTLGPSGALSGPNFAIDASLGQQVGPNLFHSFESFNLSSTETANFAGPAEITNIISRVTGGQPSFIDGVLRSSAPNADLYFLNPNGVMFGPNAGLNIPGSLYVSTANYLKLGETGRFDVTTPSNSLLTVAPVSAFGFLDNTSASITVEGGMYPLLLPNDEMIARLNRGEDVAITTLGLVGGNITIKDAQIVTYGNDVHLVSVASAGEAPIDPSQLTNDTFAAYGTISITDTGAFDRGRYGNIDASGFGGGEVFIRAGQVVLDNAWIFADTWQNKDGRGITVHANEALTMRNGSRMTTESLNSNPSSEGFSFSLTGNGGNITISANDISLTEGSQIASSSRTAGHAGDITLSVQNRLSLTGADSTGQYRSGVLSNTLLSGQGGKMEISAKDLVMEEGATIRGETWGRGDAGNVSINVDTFSLSNGSQVNVSAGLSTSQYSRFSSYPDGNVFKTLLPFWVTGIGKAGQLTVTAQEAVQISGTSETGENSGFFSNVFTQGQGGAINISTPTLTVTEEGTIQAGTQYLGNAGNILLNVDTLNISKNGFITAETLGEGSGGSIDIRANNVHLAEGGTIKANSSAQGFAGNIDLTLGDKLIMNQGFIQTAANSADGGNISIIAQNYLYLVDSGISTSVGNGLGGGGNITLRPEFVIQEGSPIIAEAYGGPGGNINITTTGIYQSPPDSPNNRISASSQFGVDGVVEINRPDNDAVEDLVIQNSDFLDVSGLLNTPCSQRAAGPSSHFVKVYSDGQSNALNDLLPSGLMSLEPIEVKTRITKSTEDKRGSSPLLMGRLTECQPQSLSRSAQLGW